MTPETLKKLKEAAESATPGPWTIHEWRHWADPAKRNFTIQYTATDDYNRGAHFALATVELYGSGDGSSEANAALIAAARTLVPDLIAECERLRALALEACDVGNAATGRYLDAGTAYARLLEIRRAVGGEP
jgi:hypothetical protein